MLSFNFPLMKQEQNLQSITLEDMSADANMKNPDTDGLGTSWMIWVFLVFLFLMYMLHNGGGSSTSHSTWTPNRQEPKWIKIDSTERKLTEQVRSLEMGLKNLALKKREAEWEIRKIEMNSMSNVDIEASYENDLKIDKLRMKIEEIEVVEEKKNEELQEVRTKLGNYQNEDYL